MKKIQNLDNLKDAFSEAERDYNYQKNLTAKLDKHSGDFTDTTILEIALWKTNRYPEISNGLLEDINDLRRNYIDDKAKSLLRKLLELRGFDLPMASTVLRFAVPERLQIIDQRVYRFITENEYLKIPYKIEDKISLYFDYIDKLRTVCQQHNICFSKSDRILYQLDKKYNKEFRLKTSRKIV